jgi:hypothetical protein
MKNLFSLINSDLPNNFLNAILLFPASNKTESRNVKILDRRPLQVRLQVQASSGLRRDLPAEERAQRAEAGRQREERRSDAVTH